MPDVRNLRAITEHILRRKNLCAYAKGRPPLGDNACDWYALQFGQFGGNAGLRFHAHLLAVFALYRDGVEKIQQYMPYSNAVSIVRVPVKEPSVLPSFSSLPDMVKATVLPLSAFCIVFVLMPYKTPS